MPGVEHSQEATGTPDPVERGFATLNTLKWDQILSAVLRQQQANIGNLELALKHTLKRCVLEHRDAAHVTWQEAGVERSSTDEKVEWRVKEGGNTLDQAKKCGFDFLVGFFP
jgi:hypothetical protein